MAATGGVSRRKFYYEKAKPGAPPTSKPESLVYDGETYFDVRDDILFDVNHHDESVFNWELMLDRRTQLSTAETKAIQEKDELRKAKGKSVTTTHPITQKVKDKDLTTDLAAGTKIFKDLKQEVHSIFAQLKTLANEIEELEKEPLAAPVVAVPQPEASATEAIFKKMTEDMQAALGKWKTVDNAKAIENLVNFDAHVRGILGDRPREQLLNKLRALNHFEYAVIREELGYESLGEWTTAPHHEQAKTRIHALHELEKALLKEYKWEINDVISGIAKMKEGFENQLKELNATLQECKTFESDVMSHLQNSPKEGVLIRIDSLEENNRLFDDLTPKKFLRDEVLYIKEWAVEYESLVNMKKHFHKELDVKSNVESNNEAEIQSAFDAKMKLLDTLNTLQTNVLEALKPCAENEILSKIEGLVTFKSKVVDAMPLHFKNNHEIDKAFELWSTAYAGSIQLKNHVKDILHFKSTDDDNDIQARFDEWIQYLKDIQKAFGVETSDTCVREIHELKIILKEINEIKTFLDAVPLTDCSKTLRTNHLENERLQARLTELQDEIKKAATGGSDVLSLQSANTLLKSEKATAEDNLRVAREQCERRDKDIETLKAAKIVLQDQVIEDKDRIAKLEERIKTSGGGGDTKTLELNDRVSALLDQLRMLMHGDASADLASRIAAEILNAFPGTTHATFIKRIFLQLYQATHPRTSKANVDALLKDLEHVQYQHDGWV
jgi:hypothetical protein